MYPLKFQPIFQKRIWGGNRLRAVLGKSLPAELVREPVGEAWELADLPAGTVKKDSVGAAVDGSFSNVVENGPWKGLTLHEVLVRHNAVGAEGSRAITGKAAMPKGHFPLLVKFLDAATDLSVQVHPDAAYCDCNPHAHLKSEAWYIMHAEPGAKIYKGVKAGVTKSDFRAALECGDVEPLLNAIKVRAGDCHYLESGTVHALGAGILAAEVQTPSDSTFRVFDWNRLGPDGKPRALHIEEALAVIDFGQSESAASSHDHHTDVPRLVHCDYFTLERVSFAQQAEQHIVSGEPLVWIVLDGQGVIACDGTGPTAFTRGDTLLLPANIKNARVNTVAASVVLQAKLPSM